MSDDAFLPEGLDGLTPERFYQLTAWLDAALPAEPLPDWGVRMLEELRALPTATSGPGQAPWCES